MTALLAGLLLLIAAVSVLRWFAHADVKSARKAINWGGLGLIALVILVLAATGRIGAAIAGLVAMSAWIMRIAMWSWSPQSQRSESSTSPVKHDEWTRTSGAGTEVRSPHTMATGSWSSCWTE